MRFSVLTIFPEVIRQYSHTGILGRAQLKKLVTVNAVNIRDFAFDTHRTTDDRPFGGGAGMVMKVEPIYRSLRSLKVISQSSNKAQKSKVVLLSARGRQFDQRCARRYAKLNHLVFICGRYEGVDERVSHYLADEEISIGPYVLSGGELGALVIIEAIARLIPGVLGNKESLKEETFTLLRHDTRFKKHDERYWEYPHYTRPAVFSPRPGVRWAVPHVLRSGDQKRIIEWRTKKSKGHEHK